MASLQLTHPHASITQGIITITDLNTQLTFGSIKNKKIDLALLYSFSDTLLYGDPSF